MRENQAPRTGKAGVVDTKASRVTTRTVLGSVSNNVRVQPSLALKIRLKRGYQHWFVVSSQVIKSFIIV
jgi:hypothetical protein